MNRRCRPRGPGAGEIAVIGRTPIFLSDGHSPGQTERYWGIAATAIDLDALLETAGLDKAQSRLRIALRGRDGLGASGASFWGDESIYQADPVLMDVPLPSGSWQIAAMPIGGWPPSSPIRSVRFLAGTLICAVLTALLFRVLSISQDRGTDWWEASPAP